MLYKSQIMAINAGHGGRIAPGAVAKNGTKEADINLLTAQAAELAMLQLAWEFNLPVTPLSNRNRFTEFMEPEEIASWANLHYVNAFVSIHADAWLSPKPQGVGIYYCSSNGLKLAQCIGERLYGKERLIKKGFTVTKETMMPAVLIEMGFMTHRGDLSLLERASIRWMIGTAIAEGMILFAYGDKVLKKIEQRR